ncbi:PQQ-dependent sugar dehydrogenase [Luteolibacter luteus]|uniref:Choice-of-anchor D domain-containing protein n=1 Tax=Luteolibacter luteus TaxID=2728835 RepID=A0A858RN29_9BACT|nr:PQQ-dependent sugar dehydrogenase [Luteolibacter luteus]QJE97570.1 choice-of-anchor D domain-containing protein [Luteolibacter luteus]
MRSTRFLRMAAPALFLISGLASNAHAQAYGLSARPDVDAYYDGTFPPQEPVVASDWSTVLAFPNLTFLNPVGLTAIPGTNKLIVWEREGKIWVFDNTPATSTKTLVVDMSPNTQGWDDSGMLGVAVHPDFANNRQIFLWYNWRGGVTGGTGDNGPVLGDADNRPPTGTPTRNRLSRFTLDSNFQAAKANEHVVIDQKDTSVWHNGGGMFFHPQNGFLYITNGDDTNTDNSQRVDRSLFSCVIRVDVDQRGGTISHAPTLRPQNEVSPNWPRYFIPNDNPFVGQANALEEIYATGLRSPHRMSIDPVTNRIFIGDVGASSREEISVIEPNDPAGLNFQWSRIEGLGGNLTPPYVGTSKSPIIDYPHGTDDGSCVVGGYVYRGTQFPELIGKYIFGDNMSGRIWYLDESTVPATKKLLATLPDGPGPNSGNDYRGLGSFGLDASGELYICRLSSTEGRIYKLQRGGAAPGTPLPPTLSATGFFSNLATLTPSDRLLPYDINAPFWSDNAVKKRFAAVPNGSNVGFQATGDWTFPEGSVFVKHFDLPVNDVDPNAKRRLETRFIVKKQDGSVYGATYKWRPDQSDADLLDGSLTENIPITTASLGTFTGEDIGSPALSGSTARDGNMVTITAGGTDIWGNTDQFHFAHQLRNGDFDISVRVESVVQADLYTKTGLMVRESLAANARHIMALVFPSNAARNNNDGGYEFQYRASTGGNATALYPPQPQPRVNYPETWLRMKREGDTFIAYSGSDGFTWTEYARTTMVLPAEIHFGMAVTAHTASPRTTAKFQIETRRQPWFYPSRQNCVTCHNTQAGGVLGLSTRQLNRDLLFPSSGVTDNQLRAWNHVGLFDNGPAEANIPALEKLAHHTNVSASLEDRARSYLDANCSYCHRPGGVHAFWDGRYETPFVDQNIYYGTVGDDLGIPDARVVVPQDLEKSILYHRVSITGEHQMPPIARNMVDHAGVDVLRQWIQSLEAEAVEGPDTLVAVAVSHSQVDLTWQDHSDNEAGFAVERSIDGLNFEIHAIAEANVTSFSDTSAEPFSTNYYRIRSFGKYVYSTPSNVASAVTDIGPPSPEIRLLGNGRIILKGDTTPTYEDGTDFRVVMPPATATRTFTIENIGNSPLLLNGAPRIAITGPHSTSFAVLGQPAASLPGPGNFNFQIRFSPQGTGTKNATVTISSNDPDEGSFTFAITGSGVAQDLVGWWKFDETTGTSAADATGSGRTGNLNAPPPLWNSEGHFGGALRFTGESGQGVVVGNHASLNLTDAITISAWAKALDWDGNRRIVQKGNTDNQYRLLAEGGKLVWHLANVGRLEATLPETNQWFHIAATYEGTMMRLYVNGSEVLSQEAGGEIGTSNNALNIGTKTTNAPEGDHFHGDLDDVRIYARALAADEIALLAAQAGEVNITVADGVAQKGTTNTAAFTITRSGATDSAVQVGLITTSGAGYGIPGADFSLSPAQTGFAIPAGQSSATLLVNPLDRSLVTGPLTAQITMAESTGYILGSNSSAQAQVLDSPLNQWKASSFGSIAAAQEADADDAADGDADGLSVLMEAALGGSPATGDSSLLPTAKTEIIEGQSYLTLTYKRPRPVLGGISLVHRTNFDLASGIWAPAVELPGYPVNNGDGTETVKVRSAEPISSNPRQFIRLEVTRP